MTSNIALITDQHFGIKKNSEIFFNSQLKFYTNQFVPYLKQNNIDTIVMMGDLFDNRSSINVKIKTDIFKLFEEQLADFHIYLLVGNHDSYFNNTIETNSLKFFKKFNNIELIEEPTITTIKERQVLLLPWVTDNISLYQQVSNMKFDVCFCHLDLLGFPFNKTRINENGTSPDMFSSNTGCKKVFSGHFHTRSKQIIHDIEFQYIGTPYQLTRADNEEDRGFTILDMNSLDYSFIDNTESLKYKKLNYPEPFTKEIIENNIIDVYVNYEQNDEGDVENYVTKIEELKPILPPNIFVVNNNIEQNKEFALDEYNITSIIDIIKNYVDTLEINNKEEIMESLLHLYNETKAEEI